MTVCMYRTLQFIMGARLFLSLSDVERVIIRLPGVCVVVLDSSIYSAGDRQRTSFMIPSIQQMFQNSILHSYGHMNKPLSSNFANFADIKIS